MRARLRTAEELKLREGVIDMGFFGPRKQKQIMQRNTRDAVINRRNDNAMTAAIKQDRLARRLAKSQARAAKAQARAAKAARQAKRK